MVYLSSYENSGSDESTRPVVCIRLRKGINGSARPGIKSEWKTYMGENLKASTAFKSRFITIISIDRWC